MMTHVYVHIFMSIPYVILQHIYSKINGCLSRNVYHRYRKKIFPPLIKDRIRIIKFILTAFKVK